MLNKLRSFMGKCYELYKLSVVVELDESLFTTDIEYDEKYKLLKHERGSSQRKTKVAVIWQSEREIQLVLKVIIVDSGLESKEHSERLAVFLKTVKTFESVSFGFLLHKLGIRRVKDNILFLSSPELSQ